MGFTIVNHLYIVSGASLTHPVTAGFALDLSSRLLEDLLDCWPRRGRATRHERRAITGTLFTTGNTGANKEETLGLKLLRAADRVREVRVTTVNDDIALLKMGFKLGDEVVNSLTGLDEEDDLPGPLELGNELLDGERADNLCP